MKEMFDFKIPEEIRRLQVTVKNLVSTKFMGNYRSVFKGRGMEFESYREYTPEDDYKLIDWKASARTNKLLMKEFIEERNLDVIFLLDTSSKMLFGSTEKIKSQYARELVASLAYTILKNDDNVSLITFNSKTRKVVPIGNGNKQFYKIARTLVDKGNYGGNFDIKEALKYLFYTGRKESLLIIVSDFINLEEDWEDLLKIVARRFDIIAIMLRDPRDRELPPGYNIMLESPDSNKKMIVDTSAIKDKYSEYVRNEEQSIKQAFRNSRSDFTVIQTDKSFLQPLIALFKWRQRKWR